VTDRYRPIASYRIVSFAVENFVINTREVHTINYFITSKNCFWTPRNRWSELTGRNGIWKMYSRCFRQSIVASKRLLSKAGTRSDAYLINYGGRSNLNHRLAK